VDNSRSPSMPVDECGRVHLLEVGSEQQDGPGTQRVYGDGSGGIKNGKSARRVVALRNDAVRKALFPQGFHQVWSNRKTARLLALPRKTT
jgi:hypothetical protein